MDFKGKTLIVSDMHIKPFSTDKKLYFLLDLFENFDNIIINGDFWSYYSWDFDGFLTSKWAKLFPILKEKGAIYIYGNHDRERWCDARVSRFSKLAADSFEFKQAGVTYLVQHGHKQSFDSISNEKFVQFDRKFQIDKRLTILQRLLVRFFGIKLFELLGASTNRKLKKSISLGDGVVNVFGHSHCSEISLDEGYVNSGSVDIGYASYIVIEGDEIRLQKSSYLL